MTSVAPTQQVEVYHGRDIDFGDEGDIPADRSMIEVAQTRAAQEVQAAMIVAKKHPRNTIKAAAPPQTPPIERNTASSCARRELRVSKAEQATPEEAAFISAHCLDDEDKTILNLREVVAAIGWQRAAEMTEEGRSKGAWKPIGWVKGKLAKQAQWGIQPTGQRPPRPKRISDREQRRLEKVAWVMERQRAEDAAKAEAA